MEMCEHLIQHEREGKWSKNMGDEYEVWID